jgi:rhamnogalacturonyl hydrolase YesR
VPKYTPTIVNSSFIGHALLDTYHITGEEKALSMALSIRDFIIKDLNREEHGGMLCFSYTPLDRYFVHNANLLGASLLVRLASLINDHGIRDIALSSLRYSMHHQREDGSWYYAEKESSHWIDSFHTGFNLQSILYFFEEGLAGGYQEAFDRAAGFYTGQFFLADGTPKYYHDRIYPIDIHAPAQAVVILARLGDRYQRLAEKVANWMIVNMQDKEGYFYFQKKPNYTNKIPYMRWGQAWAFHALTDYCLRQGG